METAEPDPVAPSDVNPSSTATSAAVVPADGFFSIRFLCYHLEGSIQALTVTAADAIPAAPDDNERYRYSDKYLAGPAHLGLLEAMDVPGLAQNVDLLFRVKTETKDPNIIIVTVTKKLTSRDAGFDPAKALTAATATMVTHTGSIRPPAPGSCTASPSAPLPPRSRNEPDDTPRTP